MLDAATLASLFAPSVPVQTPPLVDSTVIVAVITVFGGILTVILGTRGRASRTAPSPPSETAADSGLNSHDLDVARELEGIQRKLVNDLGRLEELAKKVAGIEEHRELDRRQLEQHGDRISGIERRLLLTPEQSQQPLPGGAPDDAPST